MAYAAEGGHINVMEWLLARGMAVSCGSNGSKYSTLSVAHFAAGGDHEQLLRWLCKSHASTVVGMDVLGSYSLWHVAAESGGTKVLNYLHKVFPHEAEILKLQHQSSSSSGGGNTNNIHWPTQG